MRGERNQNDGHHSGDPLSGIYRSGEVEQSGNFDHELQDPEAEIPASGGKVAIFAIAIAIVLGAVFYNLNKNAINQADRTPAATTAPLK